MEDEDSLSVPSHVEHPELTVRVDADLDGAWAERSHWAVVGRLETKFYPAELSSGLSARILRKRPEIGQ